MDELNELIERLRSSDTVVSEKTARELRKLSAKDSARLAPFHREILTLGIQATDLKVRWNLIQILGHLPLKSSQRAKAIDWLFERICDPSPLTRTFCLQALWDLGAQDAAVRAQILPIAEVFVHSGTAAMRARARKILQQSTS
jgi:hypothetical protein